jgi:putative peptide zinc metalloprotease protein
VSPEGTSILRISDLADELVPLLVEGTSVDALAAHVAQRRPGVRLVEAKLGEFLKRLDACGLLEGSTAAPQALWPDRRIELCRPDAFARTVARLIGLVPRPIVLLALAGAIALSGYHILAAFLGPRRPSPADLLWLFDPLGAAAFLLLVVPVHELCHAVACRMAGAPVGGAGLVRHRSLLFGPYVDTTQAYRVPGRWARFWIPAAGPLVDLLAAGIAASVAASTNGAGLAGRAATYTFVLSLAAFYFDTSPIGISDGSRMLEALLDDDLARRSALTPVRSRLSPRSSIVLYRTACVLHFVTGMAAMILLSR